MPEPATTLLDLVQHFANETTAPRQGPLLPTQARFETVLALGTGAASARLNWGAVTTGARWTQESRCAQPELGNPGNPAGPDVHAAGVCADGQLAYDLAFHTLKRTLPIIPTSDTTFGWLALTDGSNWDYPNPDWARRGNSSTSKVRNSHVRRARAVHRSPTRSIWWARSSSA